MEYIKMMLPPLFAAVAVIVGAYFTTRWIGGKTARRAGGGNIRVVEQKVLSKDTQLFIVRVGKKNLLLSSAAQRTQLLCELEDAELAQLPLEDKADFTAILSAALGSGWRKKGEGPDRGKTV